MLVVYFFSCLSQLADGLIYEASDDNNYFPHFYGPARSFVPLQLDVVVKADKIDLADPLNSGFWIISDDLIVFCEGE